MKKLNKRFLMALALSGLLVIGGASTGHAQSVKAHQPQVQRYTMTRKAHRTHRARRVHHASSSYYSSNPHIVKTVKNIEAYKNPARTRKAFPAYRGEYYHIKAVNRAHKDLETYSHHYISGNKSLVKRTRGYNNPRGYYRVHYKQLKGARHIPSIGYGWEGMRTYKVAHRLGVPDYHNEYTMGDVYAVENFQRYHHLRVTGRVNYKTWRKLGFTKYEWYHLDNSMPKESFKPWQGRWSHINAGIRYIRKYLGGYWISGTSSSPRYKLADCSGLAMQYMQAGGLYDKYSGNPMLHASPHNEWDSQKMWADPRIKHVPFSSRERGDLVFFTDPSTGNIWHVGVLVSRNTILDSWPPRIEYHSLFNYQHGNIAGIKRPFQ